MTNAYAHNAFTGEQGTSLDYAWSYEEVADLHTLTDAEIRDWAEMQAQIIYNDIYTAKCEDNSVEPLSFDEFLAASDYEDMIGAIESERDNQLERRMRPAIAEKIATAKVCDALEVELWMLNDLPDDEDDTMHLSFDDNGGLPDGNCLLLTDYTEAQKTALISKGAEVRKVAVVLYDKHEVDPKERQSDRVYLDELEESEFEWMGVQIANEAYIVIKETAVTPEQN